MDRKMAKSDPFIFAIFKNLHLFSNCKKNFICPSAIFSENFTRFYMPVRGHTVADLAKKVVIIQKSKDFNGVIHKSTQIAFRLFCAIYDWLYYIFKSFGGIFPHFFAKSVNFKFKNSVKSTFLKPFLAIFPKNVVTRGGFMLKFCSNVL